jgi:hypothetical protein
MTKEEKAKAEADRLMIEARETVAQIAYDLGKVVEQLDALIWASVECAASADGY